MTGREAVRAEIVRSALAEAASPENRAADVTEREYEPVVRRPAGQAPPLLVLPSPLPASVLPPMAAAPASETRRDENAAEGGPPIIEVTIGRVDVRAVTPPAPVRRESPKPQRMGLDEYLRRRPGVGA
jgi:hypothetical protein